MMLKTWFDHLLIKLDSCLGQKNELDRKIKEAGLKQPR